MIVLLNYIRDHSKAIFVIAEGCYAQPPEEYAVGKVEEVPAADMTDPILYCRELCRTENSHYFNMDTNTTATYCHCIVNRYQRFVWSCG